MHETCIRDLRNETCDRGYRISATVEAGDRAWELWYELAEPVGPRIMESLFAAVLLPAMRLGGSLHLPEGPVSTRLLESSTTIQQIVRSWEPSLHPIAVSAQPEPLAASGQEIACLFSAGVDSFYTILKHQRQISALIFVHGFDVPLQHAELDARVSEGVRAAASALGKPLLEVWTNIRSFADPLAAWSWRYHGSALASVALLFGGRFRRVLIPATRGYAELIPWGSHPLLDPLWSTEATELVHDGCEASRFEKIASLAQSEVALRVLRVCWENRDGDYNCGRCEKCLRTMVSLQILGALDRCPTFRHDLDLVRVARINATHPSERIFLEDNLRGALHAGTHGELIQALRDARRGVYHSGVRGWPYLAWKRIRAAARPGRSFGTPARPLRRDGRAAGSVSTQEGEP